LPGKINLTKMRIAVCGAGLVGAYFYRLLKKRGYENVSLFERPNPHPTKCGINPCGWGALNGFEEKIGLAGLSANDYLLETYESLEINGVCVKARLMMIDKPRLITDLLEGTCVNRCTPVSGDFDRIVDATGFARAFLPPFKDDLCAPCVQYRVKGHADCLPGVYVGNLGYAWRLPLGEGQFHLGAGSFMVAPGKLLKKLGWLADYQHVCSCTSNIRLSGVTPAQPFVCTGTKGQASVWGVGEAVGCVSPLMGEGILPGLASALVLLENWHDPQSYTKALLREFSWTKDERQVLEKLAYGTPIGIFDGMIIRSTASRLKIETTYSQSASLLATIAKPLKL
jgi:flavin-dependent dehydrogenase